jgi:8-oxo-dGTP pyrophosphatase MutT (NUDIX family)
MKIKNKCEGRMSWLNEIIEYRPSNIQEQKDKEIIIKMSKKFDDILTRENKIIHLTSSAFVINEQRDKTLMVHHNIYKSWSWTGGHADGDSDLLGVAIREAKEETGIKNIVPIEESVFAIDILPVVKHTRKGKHVASHLHISVAYLVEADENEDLIINPDENSDVKWIKFDEIDRYSNETHMKKVYRKIINKIEALSK